MAKKTRKILTLCLVLVFCISMIAPVATANPWGWGANYSDHYEWYEVYVQGNLVASGQGNGGDMYYLGTHYSADITADGPYISWYIITHGGYGNAWDDVVDLRNYITVPEGFTVKDYVIANSSVEGVNSAHGSAFFDNAIISITIETLYNDKTNEEIEVPESHETYVTVNHTYSTYDAYTGETTVDDTVTETKVVIAGESYTATPVTEYAGNTYEMTDVSPDMTITAQEEGSENVINISYLRSIDTTPQPVETEVTVNHLYYTYDVYTNETVLDGSASDSETVTEGQTYTAVAVPSYGGNTYEQASVSPAMTITVSADAAENVISIEYLRSIDTTPEPSTTVPETTVPETTVPETTVPETTVPETTVPETTVPETTVPETTVPETTVPETTVPEPEPEPTTPPTPRTGDEPDPTTPDEEVPEEPTTPDEEVPEDPDEPDEKVTLADVPKTGDMSALWVAMSALSAGGIVAVNTGKGKKEEE